MYKIKINFTRIAGYYSAVKYLPCLINNSLNVIEFNNTFNNIVVGYFYSEEEIANAEQLFAKEIQDLYQKEGLCVSYCIEIISTEPPKKAQKSLLKMSKTKLATALAVLFALVLYFGAYFFSFL